MRVSMYMHTASTCSCADIYAAVCATHSGCRALCPCTVQLHRACILHVTLAPGALEFTQDRHTLTQGRHGLPGGSAVVSSGVIGPGHTETIPLSSRSAEVSSGGSDNSQSAVSVVVHAAAPAAVPVAAVPAAAGMQLVSASCTFDRNECDLHIRFTLSHLSIFWSIQRPFASGRCESPGISICRRT